MGRTGTFKFFWMVSKRCLKSIKVAQEKGAFNCAFQNLNFQTIERYNIYVEIVWCNGNV